MFRLDGQEFMALNGGLQFTFTEAISFVIDFPSQDEVDYIWERLSDGRETRHCGWLQDRFELVWPVVPSVLVKLLHDDQERANRVMKAMFQMSMIDIAKPKHDYEQDCWTVPLGCDQNVDQSFTLGMILLPMGRLAAWPRAWSGANRTHH